MTKSFADLVRGIGPSVSTIKPEPARPRVNAPVPGPRTTAINEQSDFASLVSALGRRDQVNEQLVAEQGFGGEPPMSTADSGQTMLDIRDRPAAPWKTAALRMNHEGTWGREPGNEMTRHGEGLAKVQQELARMAGDHGNFPSALHAAHAHAASTHLETALHALKMASQHLKCSQESCD